MPNFGISAITPVELNRIAIKLRPVIEPANFINYRFSSRNLHHAAGVTPVEHIEHNKVVVSVAVDICKINAHGKGRDVSQRQPVNRAKAPSAIVDPNAIGCKKIITDVNVREPVAVHVPKHH